MFGRDITEILLTLPGIIIGLAFHEFAHAAMSDRLGDPTPRNMGRLTLSPLPHIDPIGLLLIVLAGFGWARPVQVNPRYYKNPRRDEILVSAAGPIMNLLIAVLFGIVLKAFLTFGVLESLNNSMGRNLYLIMYYTIWINVILMIFNLLPLPPLDGSHILANILPYRYLGIIYKLEQYSNIILILLIVTKITRYIVGIPAGIVMTGLKLLIGF
ncbi:MAG: site-2 protease family protein [Clostridia bacterium]|nr:site-2 protease family protein [Clostridia bacterium]